MISIVRKIYSLVATLILLCGAANICLAETVLILSSDTLTSSRRTISGARSAVKAVRDDVTFINIMISHNASLLTGTLDSIKAVKPDLLVTIGSAATRIAQENLQQFPIVFSSVMHPTLSGFVESYAHPGANITGASLDIPPGIQFEKFRQIIPSLHKVGVLYTTNTAELIPAAAEVARSMGLELITLQINTAKDLPKALDSLARVADGLWSVADPNLFDPQSTRYILLNVSRRGLPFMGFSRYVVESGALFALDFDYKAIGRQTGDIVCQILDGTPAARIPVTTPEYPWFFFNERTARHVKIDIPDELVAIAKEVYR